MGSKQLHDEINNNLEQRLRNSPVDYGLIVKEQEYHYNGLHGEIDLYAVKTLRHKDGTLMKRYVLSFETKSRDNYHYKSKARTQLKKSKKYLTRMYNPNCFRAFYNTRHKIKRVWLKNENK